MTIDAFIAGFTEEPGYLDYGRFGPLSTAAAEEGVALTQVLAARTARQHRRVPRAGRAGACRGIRPHRVPGRRDRVPAEHLAGHHARDVRAHGQRALSPAEFPSLPIAAVRAQEALHSVQPVWLETDHGKVTPGQIREQLETNVAAVAVSLVDSRTGYLCDIEGIRQVIGDRLLIVDAIQGFGIVDAPWEAADVVLSGGQKWCRAGWGTGIHGALGARPRAPHARVLGVHRHRGPRAVGRGAAARSRRRAPTGCRIPIRSPRPASRRPSRSSPRSASPPSTRRSPSG